MHRIILVVLILLTTACNKGEEPSAFSSNPTALDCTAVEGVKILTQSLAYDGPITGGGDIRAEIGSNLAPFTPSVHVARYNYFLEMAKSQGLVLEHNCGACGYAFPYQEVIDRMSEYRKELANASLYKSSAFPQEWFPRVYSSCSSLIDVSAKSSLVPN